MSKESDRLERMLAEIQNIREKITYYDGEIGKYKILRWLDDVEGA